MAHQCPSGQRNLSMFACTYDCGLEFDLPVDLRRLRQRADDRAAKMKVQAAILKTFIAILLLE